MIIIKIIDLLNKIANGEELPKKIKFNHIEYHLIDDYYVDDGDGDLFIYIFRHNIVFSVNDEVEILDDEEKKETKSLTKKDIEALGYACGEIQKCFTNGWTKSLENKPLDEEKGLPEKLHHCYTDTDNEDIEFLIKNINDLADKYNDLLDYLEKQNKGE